MIKMGNKCHRAGKFDWKAFSNLKSKLDRLDCLNN